VVDGVCVLLECFGCLCAFLFVAVGCPKVQARIQGRGDVVKTWTILPSGRDTIDKAQTDRLVQMQIQPPKTSWKWDAFLALATWALLAAYFLTLAGTWNQAVQVCTSSLFFPKDFEWVIWLSNMGNFVGVVGATLAVAVAYLALGRRMARGVGLGWIPIPVCFALGALGYGVLFLALGLCGLWFRLLLWLVLILGILTGLWDLVKGWRLKEEGLVFFDWNRWMPSSGPARFALFAALPIPFVALAFGFLPDIFYDTQVYHLAVPEAWMMHHGLCDLPEKMFASFPFLGELILLPGGWLTSWSGEPWIGTAAPRLMGWTAWILTAALAGHWAKDLAKRDGGESKEDDGQNAGLAAFVLTIGCPLFCLTEWTAQVEGVLILMGLSFLYALDRFSRSDEGKGLGWAAAAGLLFGAAVMVKYNGILLGAFAVAWLFFSRRRKGLGGCFLAFLLGAAAVALPWAIKSWAYSGNPVDPYLSNWFGGRLAPEGLRQLLAEQRNWSVQSPIDWLTLPWRLVVASPNGYNFVGPLTLVCLLWLVCTRRRTDGEKFLAWGCLLAFAAGLSITHLLRFEAALFPPLFTVAAASVASRPFVRRSFMSASGLACLGFLPLIVGMAFVHYSPQGVWCGREDVEAYLHRAGVTPYASLVDMARSHCGPSERILLVGDARSLRYGRDVSAGTVFDEPLLVSAAKTELDAEGIFRRLKRAGVDAILINIEEGIRVGATYRWYGLNEGEWTKLNGFFEKYTDLVAAGDLSQLFRLRKTAAEKPKGRLSSDGILFLDPAACEYVKAMRSSDAEKAEMALADLCARQTFTPQWWAVFGASGFSVGRQSGKEYGECASVCHVIHPTVP
jgi:hypothetical protein